MPYKVQIYERISRIDDFWPTERARCGGLQDCIFTEEYLELCRLLQNGGFSKKQVFCTSNTEDYQDGREVHAALATEFSSVALVYTNALHWAVNELKKT
jgi:hypothetical protein